MKLGSLEGAAGIAMRIDMNHANRPILTQRFEDRIRNRMVPTNDERDHAGHVNSFEECLDIGMTLLETEATLHRHVADIGSVDAQRWRDA